MFIEDLSRHAYLASGDRVRAIGWLEGGHPFTRGAVPAEFLDRLKAHVSSAHQEVIYMGVHTCTLCKTGDRRAGRVNLLIPTAEFLYVAPELIVHYVDAHEYRPPAEFVTAVLNCPDQASAEFLELLRPLADCWRSDGSTQVL